jgi:hypothetical protein
MSSEGILVVTPPVDGGGDGAGPPSRAGDDAIIKAVPSLTWRFRHRQVSAVQRREVCARPVTSVVRAQLDLRRQLK